MARAPKERRASSSARGGLRTKKKIEYNVQKLSDASVYVPKAPKSAAPKKKAGGKKKKSGTTYLVLVKRALKDVEAPGLGVESIIKLLAANDPDKNSRRYVRLALTSGVGKKIFVKTRASYRLSKNAQDKMTRSAPKKKKATTKKASTKKETTKKSGAKKSSAKKSSTKKATTKKATTKKTTTKKATTKKESTKKAATKKATTKKASTKKATGTKKEAPKKASKKEASKKRAAEEGETPASPKKKVIGPPSGDETGAVSEAIGQWQYYDGGWHNYTDDGGRIVEGVYQEYKFNTDIHVRPVQSGHFSYSVDFKKLEQTNTSTGTMRKIRRI